VGVAVGDRMAHQEGLRATLLTDASEQEVDRVVLGAALEHPEAKVHAMPSIRYCLNVMSHLCGLTKLQVKIAN